MYENNSIIPSDLSKKIIIMIGRGNGQKISNLEKIQCNIIKEMYECQMKIISSTNENLEELISNLSLGNNIEITVFQKKPRLLFPKLRITYK